ncbi:sumo-activating enzyme subunit 2 [Cavenderia fasciculata]|uniref:SUMO-activating enzyme subunit n=1 Tax=Cavenderia fasciculata TaxID=261658 RepID=F4PUL5_CACFS|nr:sumo-activating enzyme subunit 2 [Cavenderia fasciculata]EGG21879.1 sumo-activating enzyme subunit 2 [Cavenderia fasciculata]|eukprot:XP_004359730.1 sumo-activating enzyme subunit 2 [Cavenderia fasciculata]
MNVVVDTDIYINREKERMTEDKFQHIRDCIGDDVFEKVQKAKVLVVGAGGIGCELLKNLVLSGFKDIHIIDLDTIDLSNLNRQFLFRKHHIGMSKAKIAREAVLKYNPDVNIEAHEGDIKNQQYGHQYFQRFDLVMNALDNLSARKHVNRMCLSVGVPLVESGTAGYLGQATVILKEKTECFECLPKEAPKEFAVCTIRSNPSSPIHCIVWAKMLYGRLFDVADENNAVTDMDDNIVEGDPEKGTEVRDTKLEQAKAKGYDHWVFHKVFHTDIDRLARMKDLWTGKTPPTPLLLDDLLNNYQKNNGNNNNNNNGTITTKSIALNSQIVNSFEDNTRAFVEVIKKLKERLEKDGAKSWDKDDDLALDFVVAASNIRSHIFGIPLKSKFDIKQMAGNIVPAIATTNAIISGFIVLEAFKILSSRDQIQEKCKTTFLFKQPSNKRVIYPVSIDQPNKSCYVCSQTVVTLKIDTNTTTIGKLVNEVLKKGLAFHEPMIMKGQSMIYEGGDDLDKEELDARKMVEQKPMITFGLSDNAIIEVHDYLQDIKVSILISHCDKFEDQNKFFEVSGKPPQVQSDTTTAATTTTTDGTVQQEDIDEVEIIEYPPPSDGKLKRKEREQDDITVEEEQMQEEQDPHKRTKK